MKHVLCVMLLAALSLGAEDIVLADGSVLKDATVVRRDADAVLVRHSAGVQRLAAARLSPEAQKRLEMTPEHIAARRAAEAQVADARRRAKEEKQAERLAALEASGQHPRYLTGADVFALFGAVDTLSAREAEYLAAAWNRQEAVRLHLAADVERFDAQKASLRGEFDAERAACLAEYRDKAELRATISAQDSTINRQKDELRRLQKENAQLREQLATERRANDRRRENTTIVVDRPVYVPTCIPHPVRARHPRHPHRPHARPGACPGPRPASGAHVIPRS